MALNPADMSDCAPKSKCLTGSNVGLAYDSASPCGDAANVVFNPVSCDCEQTILCGDGECGYDVSWEIASHTPYSLTFCNASVCSIDCNQEPQYRACTPDRVAQSGSFYLDPNKCLRKVKAGVPEPCTSGYDNAAPSDGFRNEYWYACAPDVTDPSYTTCSTPVVQLTANGFCYGIWSGPGVQEVGRVQRVKKILTTNFEYTLATGGQATCVTENCQAPTGTSPGTASINWRAPVEDTFSTVTFSSISPACGGSGSCPSTWRGYTNTDWVFAGTGFYDADATTPPCAVSDGLAVVATAAKTTDYGAHTIAKGDTIAYVVAYGWSGAVGCTYEGSHTPGAVTPTSFACYKPSELV